MSLSAKSLVKYGSDPVKPRMFQLTILIPETSLVECEPIVIIDVSSHNISQYANIAKYNFMCVCISIIICYSAVRDLVQIPDVHIYISISIL